jgi:hypothetical protein
MRKPAFLLCTLSNQSGYFLLSISHQWSCNSLVGIQATLRAAQESEFDSRAKRFSLLHSGSGVRLASYTMDELLLRG